MIDIDIANDKVLFTLSFAAPDLRRPKAAYFPGKSVRIRRRLYSERQVFSDVHYKYFMICCVERRKTHEHKNR